MVAASPSVVDRAPGLWVYEHLVALGIDGEALEFAAPLLGSPSDDASATSAVERSARLRARIALHSVTDALAKAPDTLEIDVRHCAALRILRQSLVEHAGVDAAGLENACALDRLFAAVVVRSADWNAYKKALDALFPPDVRALSEKGKSPKSASGASSGAASGVEKSLRPELLATFSRCRSGADESHLRAQRRKRGMTLQEMRDAARNACAVASARYLGKDSVSVIAMDFESGAYAASRGRPPAAGEGALKGVQRKAFDEKADANASGGSPSIRPPVSSSPRKKPLLTPKRKRPARALAKNAAGAVSTVEPASAPAAKKRKNAGRPGAPDPYDFPSGEDDAATRAFAALGAAAAAMEAEDEYYNGPAGNADADDDDDDDVGNATPARKTMKSLGWRRGGGGVGSDRGDGSDEEAEAIAPTQAAPDEGEEEGGVGGLFSRVGGWIGLGRSGGAKTTPRRDEDEDEDDEEIATSLSMRKRAEARSLERRARADARASDPAASPGRSPPSPMAGARRKRRKGPLGNSNRHSKRAAIEANVPTIPRKKRVMWTAEETNALEAGVRALEKEGRFDMGAVDTRDGTVNDKWRRIYESHKELFDVNGRTTMDLKDKWRNVTNARAKAGWVPPGEPGAVPGDGNASPSSWRRAMINLGLVKPPRGSPSGGLTPGAPGTGRDPALPREPGISNRHSALRKKLGFSDGTRKRAQPWLDEEVAALRAGVEKEGEGKWAAVLKANPEVFLDRTAVDLKDKWRNLKGRATRTARKRVNGLDAPLSERARALAAEAAAAADAAADESNADASDAEAGDAPRRNAGADSDDEP